MIPLTGVDVIDGFNPPPVGDLSIQEARAAWGNQLVIWVNFPTRIFYEGVEATERFTIELLESDPNGSLIIGMTTGTSAIADDETAQVFRDGMLAVMNAIKNEAYFRR